MAEAGKDGDETAAATAPPATRKKGRQRTQTQLGEEASAEGMARSITTDVVALQERKEEEVKLAEMESRLRQMILEVLRPTITRTARLQTDQQETAQRLEQLAAKLQGIVDAQKQWKEQMDMMQLLKRDLQASWDKIESLESKLDKFVKASTSRLDETEQNCELQRSAAVRLGRNLDRATQDMDKFHGTLKSMEAHLEKTVQRNRDRAEGEVKRLDVALERIRETHQKFAAEVRGDEQEASGKLLDDMSPPSLRRLDLQAKLLQEAAKEAKEDIADLQRLDADVVAIQKRQHEVEESQHRMANENKAVKGRVEQIAAETRTEFARASNMMTAFSATLLREARGNFKDELKASQEMRGDVEEFVRQTQQAIKDLSETNRATSRQTEALLKEIRIDLESLESRRRRDRQGVEDEVTGLQTRVQTSLGSAEAMLKGLEHISGIIGMTLQSERISVALDLQDFVERRETPYVGIRDEVGGSSRGSTRSRPPALGSLDPARLTRLAYAPAPISYQGNSFERPQLLALREKLLHLAQEVLAQGPGKDGKQRSMRFGDTPDIFSPMPALPIAPQLLGALGDLSPGHQGSSRPGSRNQPSARGSPGPGGSPGPRGSPNRRGSPGPGTVDESSQANSPDGEGNANVHLPSLTSRPGTQGGTRGNALHQVTPVTSRPGTQ